jgi:quercetin dioxygenase-like cupin family protein
LDTWDTRTLAVEPHFPQVLRSDDDGRVIVINLPAGEELQEHQVHERAWILVADGEIELEGAGQTVRGGAGFLAHAEPNERHEVRAVSDARILLLLMPWPGPGHPSQPSQPSQRTAEEAST